MNRGTLLISAALLAVTAANASGQALSQEERLKELSGVITAIDGSYFALDLGESVIDVEIEAEDIVRDDADGLSLGDEITVYGDIREAPPGRPVLYAVTVYNGV